MKRSSSIVRYPEGLAHAMEGKVHKKRIAGNNCYLPFDLFLRHLARHTLVNVLGKTPLTSFFKRCVFRLVVAFFFVLLVQEEFTFFDQWENYRYCPWLFSFLLRLDSGVARKHGVLKR